MKKRITAVIACAMLILMSACGNNVKQRWESFNERIVKSELTFTCEVRAEYDDKSVNFTLAYEDNDDGCTVTVIEPQCVAGVKAHLKNGRSSLEFDGAILDTGDLDRFGLSPLSALPEICAALRVSHADTFWTEGDKPVVQLIPTDELTLTVWFDEDFSTPEYAELASGGKTVIYCRFTDWQMNGDIGNERSSEENMGGDIS